MTTQYPNYDGPELTGKEGNGGAFSHPKESWESEFQKKWVTEHAMSLPIPAKSALSYNFKEIIAFIQKEKDRSYIAGTNDRENNEKFYQRGIREGRFNGIKDEAKRWDEKIRPELEKRAYKRGVKETCERVRRLFGPDTNMPEYGWILLSLDEIERELLK